MTSAQHKARRMKPILEEAEKGLDALANDIKEDQKLNQFWPEFIKWYRENDPLRPGDLTEREAIVYLWAAYLRGACTGIQLAIRAVHSNEYFKTTVKKI